MTSKTSTTTELTTLEALAQTAPANIQKRFAEQSAQGVINPIVLAGLLGVKPQMIYNYLSKGKFTEKEDVVGENSTQKKVIDLVEANTFAKGFIDRKVEREAKAQAKLEAELAGETEVEVTEPVDA